MGQIWKAPPTRPFYFYGPLKPPRGLFIEWTNVHEVSVTWNACEGAIAYEIIFVGKDGDKESREVHAEDGSQRLGWSGLPSLGTPVMVKVRVLGVHGLTSERFAEAPVPDLLLPPTGILVAWKTASELWVKFDSALAASRYDVRLHGGGVTESFEVSGVVWTGTPRLPLLSAVSIRSIGSNGLQSVPSPQVAVPERPTAAPALDDSDRQTNHMPTNNDSIIRVPKMEPKSTK